MFLETKPAALSFIYQSLGCYHSLQQPSNNPFEPPSLPALLPSGFVRWQTIQILLDPDEHSEYIQRAVEIWDVRNPYGGYFPKTIPRDAFPSEPDPEMVQWHEQVSRRLEYDYMKRSKPRASPPNFGPYQYHYMPKNAPQSPAAKENKENKERAIVARRSHRIAPIFRHVEPDEAPTGAQPKKETPYKGSSSLRNDERRPQAPTPPPSVWPDRGGSRRERADFASPLGPEAMPGYFPSDPSSEDSSSPEPSPPPTAAYRSGRRNLSTPRSSRNRRHSHEAYSRKPRRDLSPEYRRYSRDEYTTSSSSRRHYDSDAPRRRSWMYKDDFMPPPSSSSKSNKQASYTFNGPNGPADPDSPLCFHVPQYANGSSHRGYLDPGVAQDSRRRSYSGGHVERPVPIQAHGVAPRWPGSKKYNIPWAMQDEYGRRVYDR